MKIVFFVFDVVMSLLFDKKQSVSVLDTIQPKTQKTA